MIKQRDMTQQQFDAACAQRGFVPQGYLGYYKLGDTPVRVSVLNAGQRRRAQLAYLIREHVKAERRCAETKGTT